MRVIRDGDTMPFLKVILPWCKSNLEVNIGMYNFKYDLQNTEFIVSNLTRVL